MTKNSETETENKQLDTTGPQNDKNENESSVNEKAEKKKKNAAQKKYFRVRFHERVDESEPASITLGINGNLLVIKRGVDVILPEEYVKLAKACTVRSTYPTIEGTKTVMKKMVKPRASFDMLGEATEKEYLTMKAEGDAKVAATLKAAQDE